MGIDQRKVRKAKDKRVIQKSKVMSLRKKKFRKRSRESNPNEIRKNMIAVKSPQEKLKISKTHVQLKNKKNLKIQKSMKRQRQQTRKFLRMKSQKLKRKTRKKIRIKKDLNQSDLKQQNKDHNL